MEKTGTSEVGVGLFQPSGIRAHRLRPMYHGAAFRHVPDRDGGTAGPAPPETPTPRMKTYGR